MTIIIFIICLLFLTFIFTSIFYAPMFSIGALLLIRASIGPLRDVAFHPIGLKVNILGVFGMFVILLGAVYAAFKNAIPKNSFFLLYCLFLLWSGISLIYTINVREGINEFLRMASPIMFFIIVFKEITDWKKIYFSLKMVALSSIFPVIVGFYQFLIGIGASTGASTRAGFNRINSLFILPNPFAFYLVLISIVTFMLICLNNKARVCWFYLFLYISSVSCLILTGTRTAFFGFVSGMCVYILMARKWGFLIIFILLTSVLLISLPNIRERLLEPVRDFTTKEGFDIQKGLDTTKPAWEMNTFQNRVGLWKQSFEAYKERMIHGHGIGSIKSILNIESHNDYIRLLVEVGLIGTALYVLCFLILIISRLNKFRAAHDIRERHVYIGAVSAVVSFMVIMLADNTISANTYLWYLLAVVAISYKTKFVGTAPAHQ